MATRGTLAKDNVISIIQKAFGSDFVGVVDKKVIVWADDGNERVQIALSLTCPKSVVGAVETELESPDVFVPAEITNEEQENIKKLLEKFGL